MSTFRPHKRYARCALLGLYTTPTHQRRCALSCSCSFAASRPLVAVSLLARECLALGSTTQARAMLRIRAPRLATNTKTVNLNVTNSLTETLRTLRHSLKYWATAIRGQSEVTPESDCRDNPENVCLIMMAKSEYGSLCDGILDSAVGTMDILAYEIH